MTDTLTQVRGSVAAALQTACPDVQVTTDPATVNPPCLLVGPVTTLEPAGPCAMDAELDVWLIHPAPAGQLAVTWLEANLDAVLDALPWDDCTFSVYPHPSGDLPAYQVTVTTTAERA